MDYEHIQQIAGMTGLILFVMMFAVVLFMVFGKGAKATYDRHARIPFDDEE